MTAEAKEIPDLSVLLAAITQLSQQLAAQAQETKDQLTAHAEKTEEQLNGKFQSFEVLVRSEVRERVSELNGKIDLLQQEVDVKVHTVAEGIDNLATEVNQKVGSLNRNMDGLVADIDDRVVRIANDLGTLAQRLDAVQGEMYHRLLDQPQGDFGRAFSRRSDVPLATATPLAQPHSELSQRIQRSPSSNSLVRDARPIQRPPLYDGKVPWPAYQAQFEIAAGINGWSDDDKARFLATCLTGPALSVLWNVPEAQRGSYPHLTAALNLRFNDGRSGEMAKVRLTGRSRRRGESLAELASDIECLVHQSYPTGDLAMWDTLSTDYFINSLDDAEMKRQVKLARPTSLQAALEAAQQLEAVNASVSCQPVPRRAFVRQVGRKWQTEGPGQRQDIPPDGDVKELLNEVLREVRGQRGRPRNFSSRPGSSGACFSCGSEGHRLNSGLTSMTRKTKKSQACGA
jgi:TolA-binding protein